LQAKGIGKVFTKVIIANFSNLEKESPSRYRRPLGPKQLRPK
jgi:hypothetical protein